MGNVSITEQTLQTLPLHAILRTVRNPRSDPDEELDDLAASIGKEDNPRMAQPPIVEQTKEGHYRLIAGERRLLAAERAGWQRIPCLVRPPMDALEAHILRLVENLNRRALHPLDQAIALKLAWLAANADAMGYGGEIREIMDEEATPPQTLQRMETFMSQKGFVPTRPLVPWDEVLDSLGVSLHPESRKKLLRVLAVDNTVQEQVRQLDLTEAALRSIGTLDSAEQQRLIQEVAEDPDLARKVRRIARVVREGTHTMEQALAEVRGQVLLESDSSPQAETDTADQSPVLDDQVSDGVVQLLELANRVTVLVVSLKSAAGGDLANLPPPWGEWTLDALASIRSAVENQ
jgi:ParB-like chromosome segregation protein Spo0J